MIAMNLTRMKSRPGMTLPEVIVALVLMGVIGTAATGVFISQSRLYDHQEKLGSARGHSRAAINMLMAELRMLERGGGVEAANASRIQVLAPFAFGIICHRTNSDGTYFSLLPGDTIAFNEAIASGSYVGYAYRRRGNEQYYYRPGPNPPVRITGSGSKCTNPPFHVWTRPEGGGEFRVFPGGTNAQPGFPLLLYQRVTYEFTTGSDFGGRVGLYRTVGSNDPEPIAGPFASTARFRFFVGNNGAAQDAAPGTLSSITGLELVLDGLSERPRPDGTHQSVPVKTAVFFWNR